MGQLIIIHVAHKFAIQAILAFQWHIQAADPRSPHFARGRQESRRLSVPVMPVLTCRVNAMPFFNVKTPSFSTFFLFLFASTGAASATPDPASPVPVLESSSNSRI